MHPHLHIRAHSCPIYTPDGLLRLRQLLDSRRLTLRASCRERQERLRMQYLRDARSVEGRRAESGKSTCEHAARSHRLLRGRLQSARSASGAAGSASLCRVRRGRPSLKERLAALGAAKCWREAPVNAAWAWRNAGRRRCWQLLAASCGLGRSGRRSYLRMSFPTTRADAARPRSFFTHPASMRFATRPSAFS